MVTAVRKLAWSALGGATAFGLAILSTTCLAEGDDGDVPPASSALAQNPIANVI